MNYDLSAHVKRLIEKRPNSSSKNEKSSFMLLPAPQSFSIKEIGEKPKESLHSR